VKLPISPIGRQAANLEDVSKNLSYHFMNKDGNFNRAPMCHLTEANARDGYLPVPSQRNASSNNLFCSLLAKILSPWPMFM